MKCKSNPWNLQGILQYAIGALNMIPKLLIREIVKNYGIGKYQQLRDAMPGLGQLEKRGRFYFSGEAKMRKGWVR
ncbi:MAG: hypothetical protein KKI14_03975 [Nanoarchaeota archaeon]|nr:hypothetical protein [Candidatus Omnitrophota bacterium]MBU4124592.1 hypothetical protein [Nanoarchaeota archaeon]